MTLYQLNTLKRLYNPEKISENSIEVYEREVGFKYKLAYDSSFQTKGPL